MHVRRRRFLQCTWAIGLGLATAVTPAAAKDEAASYWDALTALGYDPDAAALDAERFHAYIERFDGFAEDVRYRFRIEPQVRQLLTEAHRRLMSMDAAQLYDLMPSRDTGTTWRAVGLQGFRDDGHYVVRSADAGPGAWLRYQPGHHQPAWGPAGRFGDLALRAFVQPEAEKRLELASEARLSTGGFPAGNLVRALAGWIAAAEVHARRAGPTAGPEELTRVVGDSLAAAFPETDAFLRGHFRIDRLAAACDGDGSVYFDVCFEADEKALARDYPHLARMLKRTGKVLQVSATLTDAQGETLVRLDVNEPGSTTRLEFRTRNGQLLPLDPAAPGRPLDLLEAGERTLALVTDTSLVLAGARLDVLGLTNRLCYAFHDDGPRLALQAAGSPRSIRSHGRIMGFLPVWLLDLFIPSNLEQMTSEFFDVLAEGRGGEGLMLAAGSRPGRGRNLWVLLDTEVMSNGMVRFVLNLSHKFSGGRFRVARDVNRFGYACWQAFVTDYRAHFGRAA